MHGGHAALLEPALHAQIEIRRIDADEHVRLPVQQLLAQRLAQAQQARQMAQDLGQAHHRQFAGVKPRIQSGRTHARTADAGEAGLGMALAQLCDQSGAERIAGGLAGHQRDTRRACALRTCHQLGQGARGAGRRRHQACTAQRTRRRSPWAMKSSMACTSLLSLACSASCAWASASGRPATYSVR